MLRRRLEFLKRRKENPKADDPGGWAHGLKKRWYRQMMRDLDPRNAEKSPPPKKPD